MAVPDEFPEITRPNEPLAPYTHLKIGGPAEFFVQPRSPEELAAVLRYCAGRAIPTRVLGGGVNLLVIPATVGGALRHNAGDRSGEIGQFVRRVEVLDTLGGVDVREQDELQFEEHASNLDDAVLLAAEFELETDAADAIVKRMRKAWIQRKAAQPFSFQAAARVFKNPKGFSAQSLLEQAGLAGQKVGGAEVSERNANYIVANTGTTARDVLRLIDLMRSRVRERTGAELEQEIVVW